MSGWHRTGSGQSHPHYFRQRGHCGGCAHRHTVAGRRGDMVFEFTPGFARHSTRAAFGPESPDICAAGQLLAMPGRSIHRTAGHYNRRHIRAECSHQQRRSCFVAAAHQHSRIDGISPQYFFGLHRQKIAIVHRRRLHERLAEPHHGDLNREATRLPDPALNLFHTLTKMSVTGNEIVPGI